MSLPVSVTVTSIVFSTPTVNAMLVALPLLTVVPFTLIVPEDAVGVTVILLTVLLTRTLLYVYVAAPNV